MAEKISIVHYVAGRKTRHGHLTMIGGISFAIIPSKQDRVVYFGIPGAHEDFLQVYAEDWNTKDDEPVDAAIERGRIKLEQSEPLKWADDFARRTLEEVRAKKRKWSREYIEALLASYEAFNGKEWKPE